MGFNQNVLDRHIKSRDDILNKEFKTNEGCTIKVIDYKDRHTVTIEFQDEFKYKTITTKQNIKKGQIKNPYKKTIYNIGYYGDGKYTARINNKKTLHYIKWFSMFNRCYNPKYHEKQPKYIGCSVSKEFHCFQDFAKWMDLNWYDYDEMLELDKDLLFEGNKTYSPYTCCFIPKDLNSALSYKRYDKEYMMKLYVKYKDKLPKNIIDALYIIIN